MPKLTNNTDFRVWVAALEGFIAPHTTMEVTEAVAASVPTNTGVLSVEADAPAPAPAPAVEAEVAAEVKADVEAKLAKAAALMLQADEAEKAQ